MSWAADKWFYNCLSYERNSYAPFTPGWQGEEGSQLLTDYDSWRFIDTDYDKWVWASTVG